MARSGVEAKTPAAALRAAKMSPVAVEVGHPLGRFLRGERRMWSLGRRTRCPRQQQKLRCPSREPVRVGEASVASQKAGGKFPAGINAGATPRRDGKYAVEVSSAVVVTCPPVKKICCKGSPCSHPEGS